MTLRHEEEWARRVIERHLGVAVEAHDDGSQPSMFDLRIGLPKEPLAAIEVTGAVDPVWTKTWNTGPARSHDFPGVIGDWIISIRPGADLKLHKKGLPELLAALNARGLDDIAVEDARYYAPDLFRPMEQLGVEHIVRSTSADRGRVYFTMEGSGGAMDSAGESLSGWVTEFLEHADRADVLFKLSTTSAERREVFIAVTLTGAPWSVVSYLTDISRREFVLPPTAPELPPPVTGVWITSTLSFGDSVGVRWDGAQWSTFASRGEGIDDEDVSR